MPSEYSSSRKSLAIADLHGLQTQIAPEPVVLVDDDVAGRQVGERRERGAALILGPAQRPAARAEDLALGEHDEAQGGYGESHGALADDDRQRLGSLERRRDLRFDLVLAKDLPDVLRLALVGGGQSDAKAFDAPARSRR